MTINFVIGLPSYDGRISSQMANFLIEAGKNFIVEALPIDHFVTDVARNRIVAYAQRKKAHCVMVDADAVPAPGSFVAMAEKIMQEECVVACPYCSSAGHVCVGDYPIGNREAEQMTGCKEVDNIGTHLIGYNIAVFSKIQKPYFEFQYCPSRESAHGEDYGLHRKLRNAGVKVYCLWDFWAKHVTYKTIGKPRTLTQLEKEIFLASQ